MRTTKTGGYRLQYLDWMRGIGALIMLQGHVFHSFLRNDLREDAPYVFSQFVGGMPPAIFLFLTGVTLSFMMDSAERKGFTVAERVWLTAKRSGFLFLVAFLFRFQLWLFAGTAPASDLLYVDILNAMGLAILLFSPMAFFRTVDRIRLSAMLGAAIAFGAPLVSQMDWSGVHPALRAYFVPGYNHFAFFPWAAFVAFGLWDPLESTCRHASLSIL